MRKFFARKFIDRFGAHYQYNVDYLKFLLDASPAAFFKFSKFMNLSRHGESAPVPALFAARITGAVAEDCGPCVQLVVDMAGEAGVSSDDIAAVLRRDREAMSADARIAYEFADAVLRRDDDDAAREGVRTRWGDKGVIDLTFALQTSRFYPMVKAGLGFAKSCQSIEVGGAGVDVVKRAA